MKAATLALILSVLVSAVTAAEVVKLSSAKTINGQDLKIMVNGASCGCHGF